MNKTCDWIGLFANTNELNEISEHNEHELNGIPMFVFAMFVRDCYIFSLNTLVTNRECIGKCVLSCELTGIQQERQGKHLAFFLAWEFGELEHVELFSY